MCFEQGSNFKPREQKVKERTIFEVPTNCYYTKNTILRHPIT